MGDTDAGAAAFNAFEAAGWEAHVEGYDRFFGRITTRVVGALLDAAAVGPGVRVLDVASGPGFVAAAAAARGAPVTGVDVAEGMVALARRRHPAIAFHLGDAEALPFDDAVFDAVVANFLLLHLGRPERAAAEAARVLVPGGRVAATVWDVPARARLVGVLIDAMTQAGAQPPPDVPPGPPLFRFADEAELTALLRENGFEDVRVDTIEFVHQEPSAATLWDGIVAGTVRASALLLAQPPEMQRRIRAAFDEIAERHRAGSVLRLPVSVKLASARRPAAAR
jgi:SAM-dependent methyltransferase